MPNSTIRLAQFSKASQGVQRARDALVTFSTDHAVQYNRQTGHASQFREVVAPGLMHSPHIDDLFAGFQRVLAIMQSATWRRMLSSYPVKRDVRSGGTAGPATNQSDLSCNN